ncbi:MAG TPA: phage terminase large subunit, partial [bacterium]|nr:phage terminase large subunit [bacterium]
REVEVVLSGPAGTGKSRAALEKLYACVNKYPGMRGLILRQTRESLTETGLVTWEEKVVPARHPCLLGAQRRLRQSYRFGNGSEVIVGGLGDKEAVGKIMSAEYDLIFVQEATELREGDWEALTTRLRNGVMPYQQLIADCNPGPPTHWLKNREARSLTRIIESRHEDNPQIWDAKENKPTSKGAAYLAVLDALNGHRKLRLRFGKWAQAEGVVYPAWDSAIHVIDPFPVPKTWDRWWAVDFGFTNPFVWQEWAEDEDGRLYLVREIYRTRTLVEDHAKRIRELTTDSPKPRAVVCDHDAEGRATLEQHLKVTTVPADKQKKAGEADKAGIQDVEARLRKAGDGKPRLFIFRDALDQPDPELIDAAKPTCTASEFDGYVWDPKAK